MSLDGAFLHLIKNELIDNSLIGARVDKIHQPSKEEVVITLRGYKGAKKLLLCANPSSARICLTEMQPDNPQSPPMFCMLLRKHLASGRLVEIGQDGLERIVNLDFECTNEIGDIVSLRLVIEIMGRCSNIILLIKKDEWRVLDSIKRINDDVSSVRRILPNIIYELPPREQRLDLRSCHENDVITALSEQGELRADKALLKVFEGISPVFARECIYYVARDNTISAADLCGDIDKKQRLFFFLKKAAAVLNGEAEPKFVTLHELDGKAKDFCFINVEQYGTAMIVRPAENANKLLDSFYSERSNTDRMKQRSGDLLKTIVNIYERTARKLEIQRSELAQCGQREVFRVCGDIINANIYCLKKGMTELEAENYLSGEPLKIKLDERLTPQQNAQKYYADYRKMDNAEKILTKLIKQGEHELAYLDSVFDEVARMVNEQELNEIRLELYETGYLRKSKNAKPEKAAKALPPLRFRSSDGFNIMVGRNNMQNDKLTLKTAEAHDLWLHTKNIPGSHVIISADGNKIPDNTIVEAATLAAYCSKAKNSTKIPVDYTEVRFVKKPGGAKPGMVIFTNNKTILVNPDEELYNKLKI